MSKNERSSAALAKLAAEVLAGGYDNVEREELLYVLYALAGSVLTQAPDKPKPKAKRKKP